MVECGICLEHYQEGDLELHREMCVVRLMFRCSLCDEDYVSKEGLWNHLDLHEIADEGKELHYQEIKAKHKLHQCVLCNDQRAYSESPYWKHVHDVHDGFFLRCFDCGVNFRSESLKNDHALSHCKARDKTVTADYNALEEEQVPIEVENMTSDADNLKLSRGEQSSNANEELHNRLSEHSRVNLNTDNDADKESESDKDLQSDIACDICGMTFLTKHLRLCHKRAKYACMLAMQQKCPYCRRVFKIKEYQAHFPLCPMKTKTSANLARYMTIGHRRKGVLLDEKECQNQVTDIMEKTINSAEKTTTRSGHEILVASLDSSSTPNVVEGTEVENTPSRSSEALSVIKCVHCDRECDSESILHNHMLQSHLPTKCKICGIISEGVGRARYHKRMQHTKRNYECAKCSRKFLYLHLLKRHSKGCHAVQDDFSSQKSSGELILKDPPRSDQKMVVENSSNETSSIKCSHCGIGESSADTLARHILIHHEPVACDLCGITWPSLSQAQHHKKTKHKESKQKCPHCSMQFCRRDKIEKHVTKCTSTKTPCEFCGKLFKDVKAVKQHWSNFCRPYARSKKEKQAKTKTSLCDESDSCSVGEKISPPIVENGLSKTKCYYCNEELSSPGYLIHHLQIVHELTKCDICGITILGISEIKNHKMKCHTEPKYKCPICGKKIQSKIEYTKHCFVCKHKLYPRNLSGNTLEQFSSPKDHNNGDQSSVENFKTAQDQKQAPNNGLQMEITSEDTTISARDDQGQSTVNPSSKVDVSHSRLNEHSLDNLYEDHFMDVEENEKMPYSCKICSITMSTYYQFYYHKLTKHSKERFQCPYCTMKFHIRYRFQNHVASCPRLRYSCELCGQKFNGVSRVEDHKKRDHHGDRPMRNANMEGANCTEEQKQRSVEKIDEMTICIICRSTFASTDDLMKHKLTCPKHAKEHDDSQFEAEEISLLRDVKQAGTNSTIVPHGATIELKLDIKVEDTMLQEQKYQVPNNDPGRAFATTLFHIQHPQGGKSKEVGAEDAEGLNNGIKVKEEFLEDEDIILTEHQTASESSECHEIPSDRNESLVRHEAAVKIYWCSICGLSFGNANKKSYHTIACHSEPRYKCSVCRKMFHFANFLRRHEKSCSELRCNKCGIKFHKRCLLHKHNIEKHLDDGNPKDVEASGE
ncbi:zinc finger protein 91-like [Ochlerotatus camptorhynchus]|uniref:zinc finger protein 91-like n=1 Tax=Ochlerotatus camptorhynchus TaxID=644619 RepID=UPI0031D9ACAD